MIFTSTEVRSHQIFELHDDVVGILLIVVLVVLT